MPLSPAARRWLARRPIREDALARLATGGDDYEVVCTIRPEHAGALQAAARAAGEDLTVVGEVREGSGVRALFDGRPLAVERLGYAHR